MAKQEKEKIKEKKEGIEKKKKEESEKNKDKVRKEKSEKIIGFKRTIKFLKLGKIKSIILAKDFEEKKKKILFELAKEKNVEIVESKKTRQEISEELRKPFYIGCLGILKEK
ncbi:MAG: ribosomal L7Ae/L30e/S12e/Gadd45 family protein [Candidatus Pacearchaeota archaeon]